MEEAQKPELFVEYTDTEENDVEATATDDDDDTDDSDDSTEETEDGLGDFLEGVKDTTDIVAEGLERAKIITSKVNPSNTGTCRKGRSLNIYNDQYWES